MTNTKRVLRVLSSLLAVGKFTMGNVGSAEKPEKNEIKLTTPRGTTVTIEKPFNKTDGRNPPPVNP